MLRLLALAALLPAALATLAVPRHELPGAAQCARALSQRSCAARFPIDADSAATCCYNGALHPGDKESGLILATQFWNAHPSFGPANSWTVHGLWPDYCDGSYPQFCSASSGIPEYSGDEIRAILARYSPQTLAYMDLYWLSNDGDNAGFWEHEYNKHATCFSALRAKCQRPHADGRSPEQAALVGFFEESVERFRALPTWRWLTQAGIEPSTTRTYATADLEQALARRFGYAPHLGCNKNGELNEVWYYYHTYGPVVGGRYVPTASTFNSTCPKQGVKWLPK